MQQALAVRARAITRCFGEVVALDGVDIDIPVGEVHGLVGPNGAGKTTFLSLLLGLSVPDAGELTVLGQPVEHQFGVPAGVAGFIDAPGLYPALTARQNLTELARLAGRRPRSATRQRVAEVLELVGLADVADDRTRGFSLGMRQRLGLAAALLERPRLLVLDEPTNGLDPAGRRQVHGVLQDLAADGTAVVVSSHRMEDLERLCRKVTILAAGDVVFAGPTRDLAARVQGLSHRLVTSNPARTRDLAGAIPSLRCEADPLADPLTDALVVSGSLADIDELVRRVVGAGLAVRELAPVMSPLEAAFLSLTGEGGHHLAPAPDRASTSAGSDTSHAVLSGGRS